MINIIFDTVNGDDFDDQKAFKTWNAAWRFANNIRKLTGEQVQVIEAGMVDFCKRHFPKDFEENN